MRGLLSECWEVCSPAIGSDGDLDLRAKPLAGIASERYLLYCLRRLPLTAAESGGAAVSYVGMRGTVSGGGGPLGESDLTSGPVGEAISRTPVAFYAQLEEVLREACEVETALGKVVKARFQADAPDLRAWAGL